MNWSDHWDKGEKNQGQSINRKVGIALLASSLIISVAYVGYLLTEFTTNCSGWSCGP